MAEVASYYIIQDSSFELPDHPEGGLELIEESQASNPLGCSLFQFFGVYRTTKVLPFGL